MSESTLAFGIEVELLFKPNGALIREHMSGWTAGLDHSQKTNPARVNRNVLRLAIARELTGAGVEAGVSTQGYDMRSVMDEPTLDERPDFCCSMHVHVSPSREGNGYKPEQLHSIMKAVAYFDRAVTAAVPPDRKDNEWAVSNFQKGSCAPRYAELYSNMSSVTWGPLFKEFDRIRLPALIP
ncbi:uncharacterized protein G6M90_00g078690 [Metarhizium brunneum]|uniref:Uncharacterized protein n=1 Tax=Metarhizium brunneum TaxID=500148 RepID=A0A7D5UZ57_9HYPO|nr:hypothetical protein G6M90_00g078690 [Metarhizium brunneum]